MAGQNHLFPVFLKLESLSLLIVGGGSVALEKLTAVLTHAPRTKIKLVAEEINPEIKNLALRHPNLVLIQKIFEPVDIDGIDLVFIAIHDHSASQSIRDSVHERGKLANVAD